MSKLIDLGQASEETRGTEFNSVQVDEYGIKKIDAEGYLCRTAMIGNGVEIRDNR